MIMCTPAWVSSTCLGFFLAADLCLDACGGGGEHQRPLGGTSTPAPFCPALSCLFCPALSCPVLSYPALPRPALPCPALPHPVLFYPSLSCPACMTHDACAAYCFPQARCSPCFESCLRHQSPTLPAPPPRPPLRPPPGLSWPAVWLALLVSNTLIPPLILYTLACSSVEWSGVVYYKRAGRVVRIERP